MAQLSRPPALPPGAGGCASRAVAPAGPLLHPHLAGHRGGLQQRARPCPLRHDGGGRQADGHLAAGVEGRVEVGRVVVDVVADLITIPVVLTLRIPDKIDTYRDNKRHMGQNLQDGKKVL